MDDQVGVHPRCVDCGYDLHGLGEAIRCPECGRVNVPEAYRREMWELVDRGTWFFSNPLQLFRKRPPGWWWSLDRPGDVRRSYRFAAACLLISTMIMCAAVGIGDSFACKIQYAVVEGCLGDPGSAPKTTTTKTTYEHRLGLSSSGRDYRIYSTEVACPKQVGKWQTFSTVTPPAFDPWWGCILPCLLIVPALVVTWMGPAFVGLCTQIRKGLPRFARAPATVVAACNYEAHRLIYVSVLVAGWAVVDVFVRRNVAQSIVAGAGMGTPFIVLVYRAMIPPIGLVILYGALGWVGALRSDFTKTLIQSRGHATRIVLMYAIGLPLLTASVVLCLKTLLELTYF